MEPIGFAGRSDVGWGRKRGIKDGPESEGWPAGKSELRLLESGKTWEGPGFDFVEFVVPRGHPGRGELGSEMHGSEGVWSGNTVQDSWVFRRSLQPNVGGRAERGPGPALCIQSPSMEGKRGTTKGGREKALETGESPRERGSLRPCAGRSVARRKQWSEMGI